MSSRTTSMQGLGPASRTLQRHLGAFEAVPKVPKVPKLFALPNAEALLLPNAELLLLLPKRELLLLPKPPNAEVELLNEDNAPKALLLLLLPKPPPGVSWLNLQFAPLMQFRG